MTLKDSGSGRTAKPLFIGSIPIAAPPIRSPCPSLSDRFLSFKRRGISLEIQELVRPAPHHTAKPKRLCEHLLKTAHNCVPGFICDLDRQPGLVSHIIV